MNELRLSLNGEWQLYYALEDKKMQDSLDYLRENGEMIPARVPGNVELDLYRAGKEGEPFYGENIYDFRKYEFYRWQFERDFDAPKEKGDSRWKLVFEGLNCFAEIFVNDEWVGESRNAMIAHAFDVTVQAHCCGSPIIIAAAMHLEAAIPNFAIHEHHVTNRSMANISLCKYDYQPVNGYCEVPDLPGIGQELSEKAIKTALIHVTIDTPC